MILYLLLLKWNVLCHEGLDWISILIIKSYRIRSLWWRTNRVLVLLFHFRLFFRVCFVAASGRGLLSLPHRQHWDFVVILTVFGMIASRFPLLSKHRLLFNYRISFGLLIRIWIALFISYRRFYLTLRFLIRVFVFYNIHIWLCFMDLSMRLIWLVAGNFTYAISLISLLFLYILRFKFQILKIIFLIINGLKVLIIKMLLIFHFYVSLLSFFLNVFNFDFNLLLLQSDVFFRPKGSSLFLLSSLGGVSSLWYVHFWLLFLLISLLKSLCSWCELTLIQSILWLYL